MELSGEREGKNSVNSYFGYKFLSSPFLPSPRSQPRGAKHVARKRVACTVEIRNGYVTSASIRSNRFFNAMINVYGWMYGSNETLFSTCCAQHRSVLLHNHIAQPKSWKLGSRACTSRDWQQSFGSFEISRIDISLFRNRRTSSKNMTQFLDFMY